MFNTSRPSALLQQLGGLSLFSELSPRELKIVAALVHQRRMLAGEVIFDEGEEGQAIYFILAGQVTICRQGEAERPIAVLEAGQVFGELALIDGGPRSAQARAASDCELGVMFRGDFFNLMESHALIATRISFGLARHYASIVRRLAAGGAQP
ncbi:MAG: cyclic nucleotide-binding domain-containing protein [Rhodocyclales bacterium]|nr:cyclic nucleotide-binding domain-containing protein [Rhodocyclales bacterium]